MTTDPATDQDEKLLETWRSWLEDIRGEVADLLFRRYVFQEVDAIVAANPLVQKPSHFYDLVSDSYVAIQLMAIRRQLDTDERCQSLARIVQGMEKNPGVLTRKRFVQGYPPSAPRGSVPRREGVPSKGGEPLKRLLDSPGDYDFDAWAGAGADCFPPERAKAVFDELKEKTERVRAWIDRRLAHHDRREPSSPTVADLDAAIEALREATEKVYLLLRQTSIDLEPADAAPEWRDIFTVAWITPDADAAGPRGQPEGGDGSTNGSGSDRPVAT